MYTHEVSHERLAVLASLEGLVDEMRTTHIEKARLWFPSDFLVDQGGSAGADARAELQQRASQIPQAVRVSVALHMLTEEGLPMFHGVWAAKLGLGSAYGRWLNYWTAEEDRHGAVLRDYIRESRILNTRELEKLQFEYLAHGYEIMRPTDPYQNICYASVQERITQLTHERTGRAVAPYEPHLASIFRAVSTEEAKHHFFYDTLFTRILELDTESALETAAAVLPGIKMPGHTIGGFSTAAQVTEFLEIFDLQVYHSVVTRQIERWKIASLTGLSERGAKLQARIMGIPDQIARMARYQQRHRQWPDVIRIEFMEPPEVELPQPGRASA